MNIRPEREDDFEAVSSVVEAAFGRQAEARLVELIRASEHYVPQLALVAEDGRTIVGHVLFSYCWLRGDGERRVLALAPVSVAPDRQCEGIGGALIEEGIRRADAMGEPLAVVLGHAGYYPRFGFEPARALGVLPPDDTIPDDVFLVRKLSRYDRALRGRIEYPAAFSSV